ncbi:MAG: salicylate hydroxylase [Burkholderiales bacterium PBB3]|nr:MAG: salicylate hydroxylase [Burkholderiales bacterium PBB3]
MNQQPVVIVGGGLGGLSAALALALKGRRTIVLEQAKEISPIGYGIQLGPNVFHVFDRLGISDAVKRASVLPQNLVMPDADSGEVLIQVPLRSDEFEQRYLHPYVVVHRADIHNILLDACRQANGIELVVDATVVSFEDRGRDGVIAHCEDGRTFEGAALIGADGIKSTMRELLGAKDEPIPNGYVAHRTILPMSEVPPELPHQKDVACWAGPGYHIVHYALRASSIFNIVAVFKDPSGGREEDASNYESEVAKVYAAAHPALKALLAKMDLSRRWALADRNPIRQWSKGKVALLGDAAHPTLQSYAQGAGMAIEDAGVLIESLEECGLDFERGFADYAKRRLLRTARIQLGSRELWHFYHVEGIAREVRNAELRERGTESYYNCLDWIWRGEPGLRQRTQMGLTAGTSQ